MTIPILSYGHVTMLKPSGGGKFTGEPLHDNNFVLPESVPVTPIPNSERSNQLQLLIPKLKYWIEAHAGKIHSAYLKHRPHDLQLVIVSITPAFDEALQDELVQLDLEIANDTDSNLINLEVVLLPNCSEDCLDSFLGARNG